MSTFREASRGHWTSNDTPEHIKIGAIQRIADAAEIMARSYADIIAERDRYKAYYESAERRVTKRDNQIRGLRGALTRAKRKARGDKA